MNKTESSVYSSTRTSDIVSTKEQRVDNQHALGAWREASDIRKHIVEEAYEAASAKSDVEEFDELIDTLGLILIRLSQISSDSDWIQCSLEFWQAKQTKRGRKPIFDEGDTENLALLISCLNQK